MDDRGVSAVIGIVLLLGITVVLAGAVLFISQGSADDVKPNPQMSVKEDGDSIQLINMANGPATWEDLTISGCTGVPTGAINAGDTITGCSGRVTVAFQDTLILDRQIS